MVVVLFAQLTAISSVKLSCTQVKYFTLPSKITELEEQLRIVGNAVKSLEASTGAVSVSS